MNEPPIVFGLELSDPRTHVERIYDLEGPTMPAKKPDPLKRTIYAHADHPDGERYPYATTAKAFVDGVMRQPGSLVHLLPHEVGPHHRFVKPVPDMPKDEAGAAG